MGVAILPSSCDGVAGSGGRGNGAMAACSGHGSGSMGVLLLEYCEGRDLYRALPLRAGGSQAGGERPFGWWRRGRRVAYDEARAIN